MEAMNFLRFWRATMPFTIPDPIMAVEYISDEEEEDSFFDLEVTPHFDNKENSSYLFLEEKSEKDVRNLKIQKQQPKQSPSEFVSKRKILPIELSSSVKPQSPIALLKSAQTFRVFNFKKPKLMGSKSMEGTEVSRVTKEKRSLSVKFKIDDEDRKVPKFTRETSVNNGRNNVDKQKVNKYWNMFKPLYDKVSIKRQNEKVKVSMYMPVDYHAKIKFACKSRSSPGHATGSTSPAVMRRDDSLLQQDDGIQDAILHCKRSFNSSSDSSMDMSRKSAEETRDVS